MKKIRRVFLCLTALMLVMSMVSGCMNFGDKEIKNDIEWREPPERPDIPEKLKTDSEGVPILSVYDHTIEEISDMDIEMYVMGVVAGEMKNDWPVEALKAQAILARTFVLKFCEDKESKYSNADISTDIEEAQAYSYENINDRIKQAVEQTKGLVMSTDGEYPYAWFHAHSGGMTEIPSIALDFKGEEPEYLKPVDSGESDEAPESVKNWTMEFSEDQIVKAAKESGLDINKLEDIEIGERGASGRIATFVINGQKVSAPTFRIKLGADKLKSTMIYKLEHEDGKVIFHGKGFGHGVGMSQWGAYAMAKAGKNAEQIIEYYFPNIDIVKMW